MFKQTKFKVFLFLAVLLGGLPVNMLAQQKASHLEKKVITHKILRKINYSYF